jgi:hypoxanthine phosphoribosyltransferase
MTDRPQTLDGARLRPLFAPERIARRVDELAGDIAASYGDLPIVVIPVLSGSLIFAADLVRRLPMDMVIHLCGMSSYAGQTTRPSTVRWTMPPPGDLADKHVLIVDDICDTGATLERVCLAIRQQQPASLRSCVFLLREGCRVEPEFAGFRIGAGFVVGYGLDHNGRHRNRPDIALLESGV